MLRYEKNLASPVSNPNPGGIPQHIPKDRRGYLFYPDSKSEAEYKARLEANQTVLNSCKGPHNFCFPVLFGSGHRINPDNADIKDKRTFLWECGLCGGRVTGNAKIWFEAGFQAALKSFAPNVKTKKKAMAA
jgi:hypothetical protein